MNLEEEFKLFSKRLHEGDLSLRSPSFTDKLPRLLEVLGSSSPQLRDNLGWSTLSKYFQSSNCPSDLRGKLLEILQSEQFLFHRITEGESPDSVKRSFSSLAIADLIWGDKENDLILIGVQLDKTMEVLCSYLGVEKDLRGFDPILGWIHSIAHVGDSFSALISHPNFSEQNILKCLFTLLNYIENRGFSVFCWGEEFRLGRPIAIALSRLTAKTVNEEIFQKYSRSKVVEMPSLQNLVNTFRCAYLELHWSDENNSHLLAGLKPLIR